MEEGITRVTPTRRRYSAEFKARVLRECAEPGASVAGTALAHGVNANIVHKWRQKAHRGNLVSTAPDGFIPLTMRHPAQSSPEPVIGADRRPADPIQINVQRGAVRVQIAWPVQAAVDCAAWLAELIR
jgi:transposase